MANYQHNNNAKKSKWNIIMIVVIILVFLALVFALFFGTYSFIKNNVNFNTHHSHSTNDKGKDNSEPKDAPKINVLSSEFSNDFMHTDQRNGYHGITKGMTKKEVEKKLGHTNHIVPISSIKAHKYGSIATYYNKDDKVERIFVVPQNVTIQKFENYYGQATISYNQSGKVYDSNPNNSFTVKVFTNKNDKVTGIENVDQIAR
ncbi:hypothetical protein HpBTM60_33870 [Helicobacter pylori]